MTCWLQSWGESGDGRCIWHADTADKSAGDLADARTDTWERLDGAVLREADLKDVVSFAGCSMAGADLTDAYLGWADLTDADLSGADLCHSTFADARLHETDLDDSRCDADTDLRDVHAYDLPGYNRPRPTPG